MTSATRETKRFILSDWVTELAFQLKIPESELMNRGIPATAFPQNERVKVGFPDGSRISFEFSFYVDSLEKNAVAVFTEHCGYHVYPRHGLEIETNGKRIELKT